MKLNIRKQPTLRTIIMDYLMVLMIVLFAGSYFFLLTTTPDQKTVFGTSYQSLLIAIVSLIVLLVGSRYYSIARALNNRRKIMSITAQNKNMSPDLGVFELSSSISPIIKRDKVIKNTYKADDWGIAELEFYEYRKTKYSEYRAYKQSYFIAVFNLPRILPNVFFDSSDTGKREFKMLFDQSQRHSLEGTFDKHFDTYFGKEYTIDSLSFITPEVMLALAEADNYDIEIYKNKLYLYNELENMPDQLVDVEQKGKKIREKLLNNILTYRDERIDYAKSRSTVSIGGISLNRSYKKEKISLVSAIIIGIALLVGGIVTAEERAIVYSPFVLSTAIRPFLVLRQAKREKIYMQAVANAPYVQG